MCTDPVIAGEIQIRVAYSMLKQETQEIDLSTH